jgi:hypothetical protein
MIKDWRPYGHKTGSAICQVAERGRHKTGGVGKASPSRISSVKLVNSTVFSRPDVERNLTNCGTRPLGSGDPRRSSDPSARERRRPLPAGLHASVVMY